MSASARPYRRTAIRSISIKGFRSIYDLTLKDLPDLVVLHGPNGSGKSNIVRAIHLALRAAASPGELPLGEENAEMAEYHTGRGPLLREDFRDGSDEIVINVAMDVGTKFDVTMVKKGLHRLYVSLIAQKLGDTQYRWWFRKVSVGEQQFATPSTEQIRVVILSHAMRVDKDLSDRDREVELCGALLSEDPRTQVTVARFHHCLSRMGLLGHDEKVRPVLTTHDERRVHVSRRGVDVPISSLGSGERRAIFLLARRVTSGAPIQHVEAPESYLHSTTMANLASHLRAFMATADGHEVPDVDQLWVETHHHLFSLSLALEYFDVALVNGATVVKRQPRAKAARHFYEPGPIWEALRQLASSAKERSAVVFRDAAGEPVTAGQILRSIEEDPNQELAREYVKAMTEAMVLSMRGHHER